MMFLLNVEPITISRGAKEGGSFVDGRFQPASPSVINAYASVQPTTGKEVMQLPEADRYRQTLKMLSESEFVENDIITRDSNGLKYEALRVEDWS